MKKTVLSVITVLLLCVSLVLTGCQNKAEEQKQIAESFLTKVYSAPCAELKPFVDGLTEEDWTYAVMNGDVWTSDTTQRFYTAVEQMFAEEMVGSRLFWLCTTPPLYDMQSALEAGYTYKPTEIILEPGSSENLYEYTVNIEMTHPDGHTTGEISGGRVQFNEENKINYFTQEKYTYTFQGGELIPMP